jgi:hypothetical protein
MLRHKQTTRGKVPMTMFYTSLTCRVLTISIYSIIHTAAFSPFVLLSTRKFEFKITRIEPEAITITSFEYRIGTRWVYRALLEIEVTRDDCPVAIMEMLPFLSELRVTRENCPVATREIQPSLWESWLIRA